MFKWGGNSYIVKSGMEASREVGSGSE